MSPFNYEKTDQVYQKVYEKKKLNRDWYNNDSSRYSVELVVPLMHLVGQLYNRINKNCQRQNHSHHTCYEQNWGTLYLLTYLSPLLTLTNHLYLGLYLPFAYLTSNILRTTIFFNVLPYLGLQPLPQAVLVNKPQRPWAVTRRNQRIDTCLMTVKAYLTFFRRR